MRARVPGAADRWVRGILCVGLLAAAGRPCPAEADPRVRVAILPIVVYSAGDDRYLREGLGDMLASRVGRDPRVAVLQVKGDASATTDAETARQAALAVDADYVLFGSFTRFGEGASLDLQCASVQAEGVGSRQIFIQAGNLRDIIPKLDPLAEKVVRYVAGAPPAEPETPVTEANGNAGSALDALRARVRALERSVFGTPSEAASAPEAGTAPVPAPNAAGRESDSEPIARERDGTPIEPEPRPENPPEKGVR